MNNAKFDQIVDDGRAMLTALLLGGAHREGGQAIAYNAYFNGTEVVILGYHYPDPDNLDSVLTKPVAILVSDGVFNGLRVDNEAGRIGPDGLPSPPQVI